MAQRRPRLLRVPRAAVRHRADPVPAAPERSMDLDHEVIDDVRPERRLIDTAIYRDGERVRSPGSLAETYRVLQEEPDAMAWIGLYRPSVAELQAAAREFGLHELATEDAIVAHQRPKLERYDDTMFVVLRATRYLDADEQVDFGELHVFVGPDFVLTVRHGRAPDLAAVRRRMENAPDLLRHGPHAVLYAILDAVVDGYAPVIAGLQHTIDEIETQVFGGDPNVSQRTYQLSRQIIEFQRATSPLFGILEQLSDEVADDDESGELSRYLRDVADHATTVAERVSGFRQMIANILTVNATLVTQAQNEKMTALTEASYAQSEQVKKISAWAAILFAPTVIGTVYGMNFRVMPELEWDLGYPMALGIMVGVCAVLYLLFKRRDWL
ncbi:magnesium and cobalt transport protein CorA [Haloechinothrix salitolerans]|uniref:Magnesium and cobalt transport protein CorA n=1 Tax=Haloechinothrix salitolerans TaxID=926830 RepID=A0ABW2C4E7_9PSEU